MTRLALGLLGVAACFSQPHPRAASGDGGLGDDAATGVNIMFVTSRPYSIATLDDADNACADAATGRFSGHFVAWMSDANTDAIDRLAGARGWYRPDGRPFAATITDIAHGNLLSPPRVDESDHDIGGMAAIVVATGTEATGRKATAFLGSGLSDIETGLADTDMSRWTATTATPIAAFALYCFQIDYSTEVPDLAPPPRRVFVSSKGSFADVGITGLNQLCLDDMANTVALVATPTATATAQLSGSGPWGRPDHVVAISSDATQLLAPIELMADGTSFVGTVWTGTSALDQVGSGATTCQDWTAPTPATGLTGLAARSSPEGLSGGSTFDCENNNPHVYCAEK